MPPFLCPIVSFLLWVRLVFYCLPAVNLNLLLADQLLAPQFFISYLILILVWALSGPVVAAVLSVLSVILALYVSLGTHDFSIFFQALIYGGLFLFMVFFLYSVQKIVNNKRIAKEKLTEELHLAEEESEKKVGLKEALERKIEHFLDFHHFSETLKGVQKINEAAEKIVHEAHHVLSKADECVLYMVDEAKQELMPVARSVRSGGGEGGEPQGTVIDRWVMKQSRAIVVEDAKNDFRFPSERKSRDSLRAVCASPLMTENKVLGVLRVASSEPEIFTSDDLRLLDIIAGLGAVTLRNRLLYDKMGMLAIQDSLTGLYLNRHFQKHLNQEIAARSLHKTPFSVILLDVDHFKRYNDEYGHSAGDIVLKNIAAVLLKCLDPKQLAARYGGEEFILLLPAADESEAMDMAEKIRKEIEETKFLLRRVEGRVTASFGVATYPSDGYNTEQLLRVVDKRLYDAKNSGRNRVCGSTSS